MSSIFGRWLFARVLVVLPVVVLAACQAPQPPATPTLGSAAPTGQATVAPKVAQLQKIRLSYSTTTSFQSLLWVAKDKGLFEKYGLDPEITLIATQQQIAAVTAGQVDIAITSADNIVSAMLNGADLREIGLFVPYIEAVFYGRPEIKTAADLKGKVAGASTVGPGIQRRATEYAMQKIGIDPKKDVEIRVFNTTNDAFAAAKSGIIQAVAVLPPDTLAAQKAGFNVLYDVAKDHILYPSGSTYTTGKFIKEHPDMVLAYVKAISEALAVYKSDPDFAISTYMKWTKLDDREVAKEGWDVYARDMPSIPKWWPDPMKATLDALAYDVDKAKTADPASLYDNSFIEQLEKQGFYAQLDKQYAIAQATAVPPAAHATSAPTKVAQLQKIKLSYSATTAFQSLMWVAKDRGLFEKYGLDAAVTQIATTQQIAAAAAGQIDIGITSADNIASAALAGANVKLIGLFVPYVEGQVWGRPEIKKTQDLKGKVVAAPTVGPGINRYALEYALQKAGLDPKKDVEVRVFNTTNDSFAAFKSGQVQGIALFPPDNLAAGKAGFNLLYDVSMDHILYPSGSTYTSAKFIKEHPDMVLAYVKGISEALAVYKSDPDFAISTYMKWMKLDDREVAKSGWDVYGRDMPLIPKWWPDPMKVTLQTLSYDVDKAKTADPASMYDNSFIEQLEKEGFYTQLEKQYPIKK